MKKPTAKGTFRMESNFLSDGSLNIPATWIAFAEGRRSSEESEYGRWFRENIDGIETIEDRKEFIRWETERKERNYSSVDISRGTEDMPLYRQGRFAPHAEYYETRFGASAWFCLRCHTIEFLRRKKGEYVLYPRRGAKPRIENEYVIPVGASDRPGEVLLRKKGTYIPGTWVPHYCPDGRTAPIVWVGGERKTARYKGSDSLREATGGQHTYIGIHFPWLFHVCGKCRESYHRNESHKCKRKRKKVSKKRKEA